MGCCLLWYHSIQLTLSLTRPDLEFLSLTFSEYLCRWVLCAAEGIIGHLVWLRGHRPVQLNGLWSVLKAGRPACPLARGQDCELEL